MHAILAYYDRPKRQYFLYAEKHLLKIPAQVVLLELEEMMMHNATGILNSDDRYVSSKPSKTNLIRKLTQHLSISMGQRRRPLPKQ